MKKLFTLFFFIPLFFNTALAQTVGNLWGITSEGGSSNYGLLFNYDPLSSYDSLAANFNNANGAEPFGSLIQANDGSLYGLTYIGGKFGEGTLFKCSQSGKITILVNFNDTNGAYPYGRLLQANNDTLYGMTKQGGSLSYGTLFKCSLSGAFTTLVNFNDINGTSPYGSLIQATDGNLYGMTANGGSFGDGTLFKCSLSGAITTLIRFDDTNGAYPSGSLMEASNDTLYGLTYGGGSSEDGTLFKCSLSGNLTTLVNFNNTNGANPSGDLIQATNGSLYGLTYTGGGSGDGTVFKCSLSGTLTTLLDFNNTNGSYPAGSLIQASNGTMYGLTYTGGSGGDGTLFKCSLSGAFTTLVNFDSSNGAYPAYENLLEVMSVTIKDTLKCVGNMLDAVVRGAKSPYTYTWSTGATTSVVSGITSAGTYTVRVKDARGFVVTDSITIPGYKFLQVSGSLINDTGNCNGSAMALVSGGTSPYTYSWAGGGTTDTITGKCAGVYCCTVTDANGCMSNICDTIISTAGIQGITNAPGTKIFPSPNTGRFTISGLKGGEVVKLYNSMGQLLNSAVAGNTGTMQFDISTKANGIYLVKIERGVGKLIAEKQLLKQ